MKATTTALGKGLGKPSERRVVSQRSYPIILKHSICYFTMSIMVGYSEHTFYTTAKNFKTKLMKNNIPNLNLIKLSCLILFMSYLGAINSVAILSLNKFGAIFLLFSAVLCQLIMLKLPDKFLLVNKHLFSSLIPLISLTVLFILFSKGNIKSFNNAFLVFLYITFMLYFYKIGQLDSSNFFKKYLINMLNLLSLPFIILFILYPNYVASENIIFSNPNTTGLYCGMLFLSLYLLTMDYKYKIGLFYILIGLGLIALSDSRTSLIAYIVSVTLVSFRAYFFKIRFLAKLIIVALILLSIIIIYLSVYADLGLLIGISSKISQKNIESGRQLVWPLVLDKITLKPWFGWGGGSSIEEVTGEKLSAHNLYIQIAYQLGIFGLISIYSFYFILWKSILKNCTKQNLNLMFSALGILIFVVLIQNFEVTLFQNNIALTLPLFGLLSYFYGRGMSTTSTEVVS